MSLNLHADVAADVQAARIAQDNLGGYILKFQAACARQDWDKAETARAAAMASLDGYLDSLGAAYKRMESE